MSKPSAILAETPQPPYYSVTTTAVLSNNTQGYFEMAAVLLDAAQHAPGFLGLEVCLQEDSGIAVSYWRSRQDITAWSRQQQHLAAKEMANKKWFSHYVTRIAKVEREY